eukprot:SAG31_NODE_2624_length_5360_cov_2.184946_6_plen_53_part_00
MTVEFHSDGSVVRDGFAASLSCSCGGSFVNSGTITDGAGQYAHNQDCTYSMR